MAIINDSKIHGTFRLHHQSNTNIPTIDCSLSENTCNKNVVTVNTVVHCFQPGTNFRTRWQWFQIVLEFKNVHGPSKYLYIMWVLISWRGVEKIMPNIWNKQMPCLNDLGIMLSSQWTFDHGRSRCEVPRVICFQLYKSCKQCSWLIVSIH